MIHFIECRDTSRDILGFIFNATSIIWQVQYVGTGNFEIVVPFTEEYNEWLTVDGYVTRPDRSEIGFIEKKTITFSPEQGHLITVSGRFGAVLLERRLLYQLNSSGNAQTINHTAGLTCEAVARDVVNKTLINSGTTRAVSWLSLGSVNGFATTLSANKYSTDDNALNYVSEVLKTAGLGHRVEFNRDTKTATYNVVNGVERDNVAFSQQFKTLLSFEFSYDLTEFKNGFVITGADTGLTKLYATKLRTNPNIGTSGASLREYFFTNDSTKEYIDTNNVTVTMSDSAYQERLRNECTAAFSENSTQQHITGTVDLSRYVYGEDYDIGDIVNLKDDLSGINTQVRLWSITEVQDENGYKIEASFEEGD